MKMPYSEKFQCYLVQCTSPHVVPKVTLLDTFSAISTQNVQKFTFFTVISEATENYPSMHVSIICRELSHFISIGRLTDSVPPAVKEL